MPIINRIAEFHDDMTAWLDDLEELAVEFGVWILLIHHTRRTDLRFAKRALERTISPADRERVSFLMDAPPRARRGSESRGSGQD